MGWAVESAARRGHVQLRGAFSRGGRLVVAVAVAVSSALAGAAPLFGQGKGGGLPLDSLLEANRYPLAIGDDGRLTGAGWNVLRGALAGTQFVSVAEEHNVAEINRFAAALFRELQEGFGYQYVALEQGTEIIKWLTTGDARGDSAHMADLVRRYPHAPTFATDEELLFITRAAERSRARFRPVWGVDQELGALHLLEYLRDGAPSRTVRDTLAALADTARRYEADRRGDVHYLWAVARPEHFTGLDSVFELVGDPDLLEAARALQRTAKIYSLNFRGRGYENAELREGSMKRAFMQQYRAAQEAGDEVPRVLAKLGHWHIMDGIYLGNVRTFGNFLSELAVANGMENLTISTHVVAGPETWRNWSGPLAGAADPHGITLFDLRPLRPLAHAGRISDLSDTWKAYLFRTDLVIVFGGAHTGAYTLTLPR